ncbi:MAG TPA: DUF4411 family protein [Verrucomicrobiae bacterium]|nr:DUF4411 family protein [Verrucomicrobiae bacterium]
MPYCVDTSGWLDGWQRHYPPDVFPTLWAKIDALIASGEIISSEEVYLELERKSDDLQDWIKARKQMLVALDEPIQLRAVALLSEYPRLVDTLRGRSKADPFVIATAIERNAVVVPGEIISGNLEKPRVPDVCQVKAIRCINFLQMIRELKLTF